jgi:hypothetical protein
MGKCLFLIFKIIIIIIIAAATATAAPAQFIFKSRLNQNE